MAPSSDSSPPLPFSAFGLELEPSLLLGAGRGMVRGPHGCIAAGRAPHFLCTHSGFLRGPVTRGRDAGKSRARGAHAVGFSTRSGLTWSGLRWGRVRRSAKYPGSLRRNGSVGHQVYSGHLKTLPPHLLSSASPTPHYCGIYVRLIPSPVTSPSLNPPLVPKSVPCRLTRV